MPMKSIRLPIWLRIVVVAALFAVAAAASLYAYRWYARPVTLSVAVGSLDGEAPKALSAIASRLAETNAPVRLKVVETSGPVESASAFASGKTDLAVVRGDAGDLSQAQAIVELADAVVLLVAPPGSSITDMAGLKRVSVGVVGGATNQKIVGVLTAEYGLDRANVTFKNLELADIRHALDTKEVRLVLFVMPLAEKYLSLVRGLFPQNAKTAPILIPVESAGAIAEKERAYESFDIPKGTLRGSPPNPEDDVTTLKVSYYLVGKKTLDADVIADLTQAFTTARRDLAGQLPVLAQVKAPDTDPGAFLPVHAGAAEYYNGTRVSFLDKWSNAIFLAPMALGALVSVLAAAWQFLRSGKLGTGAEPLDMLYALGQRIRLAATESELSEIENQIDEVLRAQRAMTETEGDNTLDAATLNVAAHRLENLIHDRRALLAPPGSEAAPKSRS
jgi:TRAP-type uncharacterized transport system substrate-binding protein